MEHLSSGFAAQHENITFCLGSCAHPPADCIFERVPAIGVICRQLDRACPSQLFYAWSAARADAGDAIVSFLRHIVQGRSATPVLRGVERLGFNSVPTTGKLYAGTSFDCRAFHSVRQRS